MSSPVLPSTPDPAIEHYWFGKAYRDLWAVIRVSGTLNLDTAKDYWAKTSIKEDTEVKTWVKRIFFAMSAGMVLLFGTAFWLILVPVHIMIVAVIALLVGASFVIVRLMESTYLRTRGWRAYCKACKNLMPIPVYKCPSCGEAHRNLVPSRYGILHRQCNCGEKLPCCFFSGRLKIAGFCPNPNCNESVSAADLQSSNTVIAFVGSPSSGKSAFLTAAARALLTIEAPRREWTVNFSDSEDKRRYDTLMTDIHKFKGTVKTAYVSHPAYKFDIDGVSKVSKRTQLFLCDIAGETFRDQSDRLGLHSQFLNSMGTILIIDPFSFPKVLDRYRSQLDGIGKVNQVAREEPRMLLSIFISGLRDYFGLQTGALWKKPVAIVLSKSDLCKIGEEITKNGADSKTIIDWIRLNDGDEFLSSCAAHFAKYQFFSISSLTESADDVTICTSSALMPVNWIFTTESSPLAPPRVK